MNTKNINGMVTEQKIFDSSITSGGQLLTIGDLACLLNVKVKTLYSMVHRSEIPFIKVGRLLRFSRANIETWLSVKRS